MRTHFPATSRVFDCHFADICGRDCERKAGFKRTDHYVEHLRKVHGEDLPKGRKISRREKKIADKE